MIIVILLIPENRKKKLILKETEGSAGARLRVQLGPALGARLFLSMDMTEDGWDALPQAEEDSTPLSDVVRLCLGTADGH
jgi:hypothetical protein